MEYESLESHIDCQLADLPEAIRHAMSPIRKMLWDGLRPEGRIPLAIEHDCQNNPTLASGREAIAESAYEETSLNGTSIDWRYWVHQMPFLSAAEAARLMSALDPGKFCNLANRPGTDDPSEHCEKAEKIQRLAEREGMVEATPSAWIAWAKERRILVYAGFLIEVECLNLEPPYSPAQHTGTPAPVDKAPAPATDTAKPAPEAAEQRRARYLERFTEEQRINPRGALQRVTDREAKQNPKADRSNIGKDIKKARETAKTQEHANVWNSQLVTAGKR